MKIKVCGMRDAENIQDLAALKPDYMGFIFYPQSKRFIGESKLDSLSNLPETIKKTGVFVDASYEYIIKIANQYALDAVQLHGDEPPQLCKLLQQAGLEVIKAFGVNDGFYFYVTEPYQDSVDYFLFDTKNDEHGGSGRAFNWEVLKNYPYKTHYFLSGGIGLENIPNVSLINDTRLYAIDLNSKFELKPAIKDIRLLKEAFKLIKQKTMLGEKI